MVLVVGRRNSQKSENLKSTDGFIGSRRKKCASGFWTPPTFDQFFDVFFMMMFSDDDDEGTIH